MTEFKETKKLVRGEVDRVLQSIDLFTEKISDKVTDKIADEISEFVAETIWRWDNA